MLENVFTMAIALTVSITIALMVNRRIGDFLFGTEGSIGIFGKAKARLMVFKSTKVDPFLWGIYVQLEEQKVPKFTFSSNRQNLKVDIGEIVKSDIVNICHYHSVSVETNVGISVPYSLQNKLLRILRTTCLGNDTCHISGEGNKMCVSLPVNRFEHPDEIIDSITLMRFRASTVILKIEKWVKAEMAKREEIQKGLDLLIALEEKENQTC